MNLKASAYFLILLLVSAPVDDLRAPSALAPPKAAASNEDGALAPSKAAAANEDGAYLPAPRQDVAGRVPKRGVPPFVPGALPCRAASPLTPCTAGAAAT